MEKDIKTVLAECGFGFKKQFGQNFITDKNLLASIVSLSGATAGDTVVEIGCGAGTLTRALAERVKKVIGFEIDKSLAPVLEITLADFSNVKIIYGDFMKADLKELEKGLESYRVVANLPYYITTPLIMKLVEQSEKCLSLSVMVQEEVADRLCAQAGTPQYGAITAAVAYRADCTVVKRVPRTVFFPQPNVDSEVVKLEFRRKTLENNLVNCFCLSRENARHIIEKCGLDLKARGETLSPVQFAKLSDLIADIHNM